MSVSTRLLCSIRVVDDKSIDGVKILHEKSGMASFGACRRARGQVEARAKLLAGPGESGGAVIRALILVTARSCDVIGREHPITDE